MSESRILMGVVGRPHGVRGLVRVHSYTAEPADLATYSPLFDEQGRAWSLAWRGDGVAELSDASGRAIADRSEAEKLVNLKFYADRACLPKPEKEEFYLADLIGTEAFDGVGKAVGRVSMVHDYGAGCSIEIERPGGMSLIVPFTRACVPDIDVAARRLVVSPPVELEMREGVA